MISSLSTWCEKLVILVQDEEKNLRLSSRLVRFFRFDFSCKFWCFLLTLATNIKRKSYKHLLLSWLFPKRNEPKRLLVFKRKHSFWYHKHWWKERKRTTKSAKECFVFVRKKQRKWNDQLLLKQILLLIYKFYTAFKFHLEHHESSVWKRDNFSYW